MDCSPPGSSVPGILQARVLDWAAISFSPVMHSHALMHFFGEKMSVVSESL